MTEWPSWKSRKRPDSQEEKMALRERKGFVCFVSFCSGINKFMVELVKQKELVLMINMDMDTKN